MVRQSLAYGTLVLTAANFFNRLLGFAYQIALIHLIGAEGIGLFNMVYPLYVLALVMASAGIPVALAKIVAEDFARQNLANVYRAFRLSLCVVAVSSLGLTLLLTLTVRPLSQVLFPNPDTWLSFQALVPGVFVVSVCSAFRGLFQGLQQMSPIAQTQAAEQVVRVIAGLGLAYILLPFGVIWATAGAAAGVIVGEAVGFMLMVCIFMRWRPRHPPSSARTAQPLGLLCRRIFSLALPVTATRLVSTILLSIDALLIPQRLKAAGFSVANATAAYGKLAGMAETMLFTPSVLTLSLATALIPAVSDAQAQRDHNLLHLRISEAIRLTMYIGLPCAAILFCLPEEICGFVFGYADAGKILAVLAIGGPFLYLQQTTTGILQGLGRVNEPLKNLILASAFKILGIYFLTSIPPLGIVGTAGALVFYYILNAVLNFRDLTLATGFTYDYVHLFLKPGMAAVLMMLLMWCLPAGGGGLSLLTLILVVLSVYFIALYLTRGIDNHDLWRVGRLFLHFVGLTKH
ncbi:MAG: stage V sporulation protein B [Desulfotomaculales bacterium]